ncbi:hypothetical protein [Gloeocapsa sp. PCC 73106]|uniref:hypothetical protein n=1 Tax=Gloeocapsa sp. PCC 73106 TaxID=102232 RepID=UPI0002AC6164|nr:hypothetical protein [Gloeocapsa sp. PCC 73106]ELR98547.1 hypothetical protein GLO73106DRAFT_00023810 [Gloeocapsa sp. PCC 73106]
MSSTPKNNNYLIDKSPILVKILKKIKHEIKNNIKQLLQFNYPKPKRIIYERFCYLVNSPTYLFRKYLSHQLIQQQTEDILPSIPEEAGFLTFSAPNFQPLQEAIEYAQLRLTKTNINDILSTASGKHQYLLALPIKHELTLDSPLLRLALDPVLVRTVTKYMGILPILNSVNILYSPNHNIFEDSSQYFHLDPEGVKQVKIFIYLDEVTEDSGPFTLIPAIASKKIYPLYQGGRLSDEFISEIVPKSEFTPITGPAGTIILVDTSSCFHFGSRPGKKDRPALLLQYVSPFAMIFPHFGWGRKTRLAHLVQADTPILERYLLGAGKL